MSSFQKHNPMINAYGQESEENLKDLVMMVALSIQQPWSAVGGQMQDYRQLGAESRFVWGNKSNTLAWLDGNVDRLYADAMAVVSEYRGRDLDIKLMEVFIQVDGMGLAKSQAKKIEAYVDACRQRRSAWLWDSWCNLIAKKQPNKWVDGDAVSQVHMDYLVEVA